MQILNDRIKNLNHSAENLKEMYIENHVSKSQFNSKNKDISDQLISFQNELLSKEQQYKEEVDVEKYTSTFEYIYKMQRDKIEKYLIDFQYYFIRAFVDKIIIYSRDKKEGEKFSGRQVEGQKIPCKIEVHFKLPQESIDYLWKSINQSLTFEDMIQSSYNPENKYMFLESNSSKTDGLKAAKLLDNRIKESQNLRENEKVIENPKPRKQLRLDPLTGKEYML